VSEVELSFCVVNTEQRELLVRCLDAVAAERDAQPFPCEVLVLDNASRDGSAGAARHHPTTDTVVVNEERRGKGENDTALLRRARGRFCLLLNEDSELRPGAVMALRDALEEREDAAAAGARLLRPDGVQQPSAWRFPTALTALVGALFLPRRYTVQSRGEQTCEVDWAQSAALLVDRAAAAEIGWFDPAFFVYSDEVDFCKRLADAGWTVQFVPAREEGMTQRVRIEEIGRASWTETGSRCG
jgi:GT2 family glycosyltransferase